jgi:protein phosphatase
VVSRDVDAMNARLPALSSDAVHADQTCREATFASRFVRLDTAVASSRGVGHTVNEDCHSALHGRSPVFVVADGVGGGALASRASEELVSRLHATLVRGRIAADTIHAAILEADRGIEASIASRTSAPGAATLALCAATDRLLSRWIVGWVGDCRVYRVGSRGGDPARLLTRDDSYRHLHEQPPSGVSTDDPARMVGNGAIDAPNLRHVELAAGAMLVLCSDGVHKHVAAVEIADLLRGASALAPACMRLVELARKRGSRDDATVLVVRRALRVRDAAARAAAIGALLALMVGTIPWLMSDGVTAASGEPVTLQPQGDER